MRDRKYAQNFPLVKDFWSRSIIYNMMLFQSSNVYYRLYTQLSDKINGRIYIYSFALCPFESMWWLLYRQGDATLLVTRIHHAPSLKFLTSIFILTLNFNYQRHHHHHHITCSIVKHRRDVLWLAADDRDDTYCFSQSYACSCDDLKVIVMPSIAISNHKSFPFFYCSFLFVGFRSRIYETNEYIRYIIDYSIYISGSQFALLFFVLRLQHLVTTVQHLL